MGLSVDKAKEAIQRGRKGLNTGLNNGFDNINKFLYGVQEATYYHTIGDTGSGKTALIDSMFMYNPYIYAKEKNEEKNITFLYYSLEIAAENKIIKFIARRLWEKHGIVVDSNYLLSRGKYKLSDEHLAMVEEEYSYFEAMEKQLIIKDNNVTYDSIKKDLYDLAKQNGTISYINGKIHYNKHKLKSKVIVILDHIGLIATDAKKANIDKISRLFVECRNNFGFTFVTVSQVNRDASSSARRQSGFIDFQISDSKDTASCGEDADVMLAIFSPHREKQENYLQYDVKTLKDRFRVLQILKNRNGEAEKRIALNFFGEFGLFKELPLPNKIVDINKYTSPSIWS